MRSCHIISTFLGPRLLSTLHLRRHVLSPVMTRQQGSLAQMELLANHLPTKEQNVVQYFLLAAPDKNHLRTIRKRQRLWKGFCDLGRMKPSHTSVPSVQIDMSCQTTCQKDAIDELSPHDAIFLSQMPAYATSRPWSKSGKEETRTILQAWTWWEVIVAAATAKRTV